MSLKFEKENAIKRTREFLMDLLDRSKTKRVPSEIRKAAYWCLRHFPHELDLLVRDDDGKFRIPTRSKQKKQSVSGK
jgi:hypothetical protein